MFIDGFIDNLTDNLISNSELIHPDIIKLFKRPDFVKRFENIRRLVRGALKYLDRYGYLPADLLTPVSLLRFNKTAFKDFVRKIKAAIKRFQQFSGIERSGQFDVGTIAKMSVRRCGGPDVDNRQASTALAISDSKWKKRDLKYCVESYVRGLTPERQDELIAIAWTEWANHVQLNFQKVESANDADIRISLGAGSGDDFDGAGGKLAWAFLPPGDDRPLTMKYDAEEDWSDAGPGIRFLNVTTHEFGHLLGLAHIEGAPALMNPFYAPGIASPLAADIARIQQQYGAGKGTGPGGPGSAPRLFGPVLNDEESISFSLERFESAAFPISKTNGQFRFETQGEGATTMVLRHIKDGKSTTVKKAGPTETERNAQFVANMDSSKEYELAVIMNHQNAASTVVTLVAKRND